MRKSELNCGSKACSHSTSNTGYGSNRSIIIDGFHRKGLRAMCIFVFADAFSFELEDCEANPYPIDVGLW